MYRKNTKRIKIKHPQKQISMFKNALLSWCFSPLSDQVFQYGRRQSNQTLEWYLYTTLSSFAGWRGLGNVNKISSEALSDVCSCVPPLLHL
jgi:hypothetical protein